MRRASLSVPATILFALSWTLLSCSAFRVARHGADGAVHGVFDGLTTLDPAVRRKVYDAYLGDLNVQKGVRTLSQNLVLGIADGLADTHAAEVAGSAANAAMTLLRQQGGQALADLSANAGPELERALRIAIADSIATASAALRQSATRDLSVATRVLVGSAIDATMDQLGQYLQSADPVGYTQTRLAPAAGRLSRTMMREAILGLNEGIGQAVQGQQPPLRALMREVGMGLAEGMRAGAADSRRPLLLWNSLIAVSGLLLLALLAAMLLWRRYRQTTKSLMIYARQLSWAQQTNQTYGQKLQQAIQEAHAANKHDAWLTNFLIRQGLAEPPPPASAAVGVPSGSAPAPIPTPEPPATASETPDEPSRAERPPTSPSLRH